MKSLPLGEVYKLIEPGPVVLLTTWDEGRVNVMPMSWHMMMEFVPPTLACVVSSANHSHAALRKSGQCVIAIPAARQAKAVVKAGNCSGRDVDKFSILPFTPLPAQHVAAPLIAECFANLECKVVDHHLAKERNCFILEVVAAWILPSLRKPKTLHHQGFGSFAVDGETIKLASGTP